MGDCAAARRPARAARMKMSDPAPTTANGEEIMIGEDKLIKFSGCARGDACTIVLRGASSHLLDEAERSLHDALCVIVETVKVN